MSAGWKQSPMAAFRDSDSASGEGIENTFCVSVANHREHKGDNKVRLLLDILWGTWSGMFDDEFQELSQHDMDPQGPFLWHRFLSEDSAPLGLAYRAFLSACTSGPILANAPGACLLEGAVGSSEWAAEEQATLKRTTDQLMSLRRKTVTFVSLPADAAVSGAEYTSLQLQRGYESMRLGHKFSRKKGDVRAFVFSADLFPPNVLLNPPAHGTFAHQITADTARMKRTVDFMVQKRTKDDVVLLLSLIHI